MKYIKKKNAQTYAQVSFLNATRGLFCVEEAFILEPKPEVGFFFFAI